MEEIPLISSADALQISHEECESLDDVLAAQTDPVQKDVSEFIAIGAKIQSTEDAHNLYKKFPSIRMLLVPTVNVLCTGSMTKTVNH